MFLLRHISNLCAWIAAVALAIIPIAVALDFGGILWWTQHVACLGIMAVVLLTLPAMFSPENPRLMRQLLLLFPLLAWFVFAWFQTVSMSPGLVGLFSGASREAYTDWISAYVSSDQMPTHFPISIAVEQSKHSLAMLMALIGVVWASSMVFVTRKRIGAFFGLVALGGAIHAGFGLYRLLHPETTLLGIEFGPTSFGSFVNRNNAALMMSIGLAASLGLLSWRLTALTGRELDDRDFELNDLIALIGDRESVIGVLGAVACSTGLLVCGSRGGMVGAVAGLLFALGWVRQRRGWRTIPVVAATVLVCVALLVVPLKLNLESVSRLETLAQQDATTILRDGRLEHWRDGLRTAWAHLPMGSGLGTYGYAYLPHQQYSTSYRFEHADNLWLELLVEQGIPGVLLAIALIVMVIRALRQLSGSVDPLDHGLRVAGWYLIGSIIASQLFDFGLILPGNLLVAAVFLSVIVARGAIIETTQDTIEFRSLPKSSAFCALGVVSVLLVWGALVRTGEDAEVEGLSRTVTASFDAIKVDPDALSELSTQVRQHPRAGSSPILLESICSLDFQRARMAELTEANPATPEEALALYRDTDRDVSRLRWRQPARPGSDADSRPVADDSLPEVALNGYRSVMEACGRSFVVLPLGSDSRYWQFCLDFIHQDYERSQTAIAQLYQFNLRNPKQLLRLGTCAASSDDGQMATKIWRSLLEVAPEDARPVALLCRAYPDQVKLEEVLPSNPTVYRQATPVLLAGGEVSDEFLRKAAKEIACERCNSKKEKSQCLELAGDIAYRLKDHPKAFVFYEDAVRLSPSNLALQIKRVSLLREAGRRSEALAAAREAALQFDDEPTLGKIIEELSGGPLRNLAPQP